MNKKIVLILIVAGLLIGISIFLGIKIGTAQKNKKNTLVITWDSKDDKKDEVPNEKDEEILKRCIKIVQNKIDEIDDMANKSIPGAEYKISSSDYEEREKIIDDLEKEYEMYTEHWIKSNKSIGRLAWYIKEEVIIEDVFNKSLGMNLPGKTGYFFSYRTDVKIVDSFLEEKNDIKYYVVTVGYDVTEMEQSYMIYNEEKLFFIKDEDGQYRIDEIQSKY